MPDRGKTRQLAASVQLVGSGRGERKCGNSNKQGKGKGKDGKGKLGALKDQQHPQIAVQAPSWSAQHAQHEWHEGKQQHQPTWQGAQPQGEQWTAGLQDDSSHNVGWQDSGWIGGSADIGTVSQSDERESPWYMVRSRCESTMTQPSQHRREFRGAPGATLPNLGRVVLATMDAHGFETDCLDGRFVNTSVVSSGSMAGLAALPRSERKKRVQFLTAIDGSSGSGGGAACTAPPWKWKELEPTQMPGRPGRKTACGRLDRRAGHSPRLRRLKGDGWEKRRRSPRKCRGSLTSAKSRCTVNSTAVSASAAESSH